MKKVLLVIGIIVLLLAAAAVALLIVLSKMPAVPEDYTETVPTGGELEAAYLAMGACEVGYYESGSLNSFEKYEIYYPLDIAQRGPFQQAQVRRGRCAVRAGKGVQRAGQAARREQQSGAQKQRQQHPPDHAHLSFRIGLTGKYHSPPAGAFPAAFSSAACQAGLWRYMFS